MRALPLNHAVFADCAPVRAPFGHRGVFARIA
jgi:hypothetical protein